MNQRIVFSQLRQLAPLALVFFSAMIAMLAYLQALDYPFFSDDTIYITENTRLLTLPLPELWRLFTGPYNEASEFLPLREFSYWLDATLFGLYPPAFRWHNIVLYLLCLPLVYGITLHLWRLFLPADPMGAAASTRGMRWAAATVAALFALHPSHVEAVVWIAGRKDVLSGMFSLLALWLALRAKQMVGFSTLHASTALLALLTAMLSKATAVAVAPVIAMLWVVFWRDIPAPERRHILLLWPLTSMVLAACIALVFSTLITSRSPLYFGVEAVTRSLAVLGWLARLAVSPESRHYIYPVFEDPYFPIMVFLGMAVLAAASVGMIILYKNSQHSQLTQRSQYSLEGFALVSFLLLCLPSLQLIPYAPPSLVSDRFVFLAAWPAVLLLVVLSWRLQPVLRILLLFAIMVAFGYQTTKRPRDWRSHETIIEADFRVYPGNNMLAMNKVFVLQLPQGLFHDAKQTAHGITDPEFRDDMLRMIEADYAVHIGTQPQEATALLWQWGLDLKRQSVQAQWNTPIRNLWAKREYQLLTEWEDLIKRFPYNMSVRYNAGLWMLEVNKYRQAEVHLRAATESQHLRESERGTAFYNFGLALVGDGRITEAEIPLYKALMQSPPDLRALCLLAEVYRQTSRFKEAASAKADCPNAPNEKAAR